MVTPERWVEVERLFHAALERPPLERAAFLDDSCAGDISLRDEVQSLLDESSPGDEFLEGPPLAITTAIDLPQQQRLLGRRLSEYELRSWLGAGGMGEVYRARDVKLGREVAIKVLPEQFSTDPERVARFKREATILATLNHPNIAAIYALEESEDVVGLVLELVEGPTLADRLLTGPLPVNDALAMARQTAAAIESAHAKGIVHRDLKPANIKLTATGTVKVLDFGLAKAVDRVSANTARPTIDATREGTILGTAAYMSPEQARGLPVDERTDIWAFGCVLYEALAGRKAFRGNTLADCVAAVLGGEPDWNALPASTPATMVSLVRRCLEKDVTHRLANISTAQLELDAVLEHRSGLFNALRQLVPHRRPKLAYAGAAAVLLIAGAVGLRTVTQMTSRPERVDISLANGEFIPPTHSSELALSPDGSLIAYAASKTMNNMPGMSGGLADNSGLAADMAASMPAMSMAEQIFLRRLSQQDAKPVGNALGSAPFFSPDGKWLGFWHTPSGTLRKVALTGGAPVRIASAVSGVAGAAWGADDTIVFAWFDLFQVPAAGGSPKVLLKVDEQRGERFYRHPSFLPSGKAVLFTVGMADAYSYDDANIGVVSLTTGEKKILIEGGSSARYSPSGHLIYARSGKLLAIAFDPDKLEILGQPFPVVDGVFMSANTGMAAYAISASGRLLYAAGPVERGVRVPVWVDRRGKVTTVGSLPPRSYLHPRLSPDERQLAIEVEGASHDIFTYDFARGVTTKMSFDGASHWPLWTPDGKRLTFRSWKTGTMTMWWMPADRSSGPELLTNVGSMQSPESWSPDGRALAFTQMDNPESGSDVYVLPVGGSEKPRALIKSKFSEGSPKFSPDGRWLAYSSDESGRPEVYAMAYPGPGSKITISTDGGTDPVWRRDGHELFYRNGDQMMAVVVSSQPFAVSKPKVLWEGHYLAGVGSSCGMSGPTSANYDVSADGQRFLMIEDTSSVTECKLLHVVSNWSRDVTKAAPAGN